MAKKVDKVQKEIVGQLRDLHIYVRPMHEVGKDFPDLLCCAPHVQWVLIELKDGLDGRITCGQLKFLSEAPGYVGVAYDFNSAYRLAVLPSLNALNRMNKEAIAAWLIRSPGKKDVSVRKFFREVLTSGRL